MLPLHMDGDGLLGGDHTLVFPRAGSFDPLQLPVQDVPTRSLGMTQPRPYATLQEPLAWNTNNNTGSAGNANRDILFFHNTQVCL